MLFLQTSAVHLTVSVIFAPNPCLLVCLHVFACVCSGLHVLPERVTFDNMLSSCKAHTEPEALELSLDAEEVSPPLVVIRVLTVVSCCPGVL